MHHRLILAVLALALPTVGLRAELAPSSAKARPLTIGRRVPAALVQTVDGAELDLAAACTDKPTLVVFYRGSWCPYCNRHLAALQEIEPRLLEMGYQILAISPDQAEGLRDATTKNHLNYRLLSDRGMKAADAFGLAFRVDAKTVEKYREYKIDLAPVPGEPDARWLPVPAVYLIGRDGTVKFVHTDPDYKARLSGAAVIAAAQAAL